MKDNYTIFTTSPAHFSLKGCENVPVERGSERVNAIRFGYRVTNSPKLAIVAFTMVTSASRLPATGCGVGGSVTTAGNGCGHCGQTDSCANYASGRVRFRLPQTCGQDASKNEHVTRSNKITEQ